MRIPLWIGGPVLIALSAADAALELQARTVRGLTRTVIRTMSADAPVQLITPESDAGRASRTA
ncbi:hypothetical protein [Rhodococcus sp. NPDC003348]